MSSRVIRSMSTIVFTGGGLAEGAEVTHDPGGDLDPTRITVPTPVRSQCDVPP